jgi:hypothetical protein
MKLLLNALAYFVRASMTKKNILTILTTKACTINSFMAVIKTAEW